MSISKKDNYMISTTVIICANCGKEKIKKTTEINRQKKKGKTLFYCNLKCAGQVNHAHLKPYQDQIKKYSAKGNWTKKTDVYSPFRYHLNNAKRHCKKIDDINIDLEYLKTIWDNQNGKCAVTGLDLQVKHIHTKTNKTLKNPYQASLDRIDNSKGYIKGNVRFVCLMFNYARNNFSDNDVLEFCQKVVSNRK
jgi:hypothetical protein